MSQTNLELIRGMYEAFAAGDVPTVLGLMDEKIDWREADNFLYADGNPYVGPQAVLEGVFMRLANDWDDFAVQPEEWFDAGDTIVVCGHYTGTSKATGRSVRAQFAHVWTMQNGKVVRFRQYTDTRQWADAAA
ncbi:MAG: nuclear transport factor 2 family protein [Pyrinomonadaceae bacterium]